ncbi:MAG TPA: MEDS domain-containing protein [Actinomycetota bacterium]|nr:MEDS domain-containing protein [Actinomycetota bacterium]
MFEGGTRVDGRIADPGQMSLGDHICWTIDRPEEHAPVLCAYFMRGLELGCRLFYACDRFSPEEVADQLTAAGLDVPALQDEGTLVMLSASEIYPPAWAFHGGETVARFRQQADLAVADGYAGLCAAGDPTALLRDGVEIESIVEYELLADRTIRTSPLMSLCIYDGSWSSGSHVRDILAAHPAHLGARPAYWTSSGDADGLALRGEVDMAVGATFWRTLEAVARIDHHVTLDVSSLRFLDVDGMRALERLARALYDTDRRLTLVAPSRLLSDCLSTMAVDRLPNVKVAAKP